MINHLLFLTSMIRVKSFFWTSSIVSHYKITKCFRKLDSSHSVFCESGRKEDRKPICWTPWPFGVLSFLLSPLQLKMKAETSFRNVCFIILYHMTMNKVRKNSFTYTYSSLYAYSKNTISFSFAQLISTDFN